MPNKNIKQNKKYYYCKTLLWNKKLLFKKKYIKKLFKKNSITVIINCIVQLENVIFFNQAFIYDCNFQMHVISIPNMKHMKRWICVDQQLLWIQPLRDTENTRLWAAHMKMNIVPHFTLKHAVHIFTYNLCNLIITQSHILISVLFRLTVQLYSWSS